jgi:hypothetical protein
VIVLPIRVTAEVVAIALPSSVAADPKEIDSAARMLPTKALPAPKVAELATCQ